MDRNRHQDGSVPEPAASRLSPADAPANLNEVWARILIEELCRHGVRQFVVAPGSRSGLLSLAAHRLGASCLVHWDERAAGFYALGHARATGRPAVVITTSGTAAANLLPAVVEASVDGVPLIVVSADRPPELRDTGANQTIDQVHLFGRYVRWFHELGPSAPGVPARTVLTAADHAFARATDEPGPVHLNMLFREPLSPGEPDGDAAKAWASLGDWLIRSEPHTRAGGVATGMTKPARASLAEKLDPRRRGVIVVGGGADPDTAKAALRVAERCRWPLLADVQSGLRFTDHPQVIAYADAIMLSSIWMEHLKAECVIQVGGRITSKRILRYLQASVPADWVLVKRTAQRIDEIHRVTWSIRAIASDLEAVADALPEATPGKWLGMWQDANHLVDGALDKFLDVLPDLNEAVLARALSRAVPGNHGVFVGNSMPIRDLDRFGAPGWGGRPAANRGASGIDGLVATAAGYAGGTGKPLTVLIGDVSLLHDLTSLRLAAGCRTPFILNIINNDGGGIFHFLPINGADAFEPVFAAPHGLDFQAPAEWLGLRYAKVDSLDDWEKAYAAAIREGGTWLIEIVTDRGENLNVHRALEQRIINALDDMAPYQ